MATTAIEFAMVAPAFLFLIVFVFEVGFDFFTQSVLDHAVQIAARKIQTGNAQNVVSASDFTNKYLCPAMGGMLGCGSLFVKLQRISPTTTQDFFDYTTGTVPVSNTNLDMSSYADGSFCNAPPSQMFVLNVAYLGPNLISGFVPGIPLTRYNGTPVHVTVSTIGLVTEAFSPAAAVSGGSPTC